MIVKKFFKFIYYIFYKYYSTGVSKDWPFMYTVFAFVGLFILQSMQILLLIYKFDSVPVGNGYGKLQSYGCALLFVVIIYWTFYLLLRKFKYPSLIYSSNKIRKGQILLIGYILFLLISIVLIIIIKYGK